MCWFATGDHWRPMLISNKETEGEEAASAKTVLTFEISEKSD